MIETVERLDRVSAGILAPVLNQGRRNTRASFAYGGYGVPATRSVPDATVEPVAAGS